jgi:hypothetical protein
MADCGELVSKTPEEEFDEELVETVPGTCVIDPLEGAPDQERELKVDIENRNPVLDAEVDVEWRDRNTGAVLKRYPNQTVPADTRETITATVKPANTIGEGRFPIRAVVASAVELAAAGSALDHRVRAGAPGGNGETPVPDGGAEQSAARTALARACGGCAERSRKLSAHNRRIRDVFELLGDQT